MTITVNLLPFIVAGLVSGAVYGLAGVGLVLTYKTSGIFNFAHGAIATVSAYLYYTLHVQQGMPAVPAIIVTLVACGGLLGMALERLGRALTRSSLVIRVLGMVGLLIIVQSLAAIIYGTSTTRVVPPFLSSATFHLGSTTVTYSQVIIFGIALVATTALSLYFRYARMGVAMRAVVDDPELLDIGGTSPVAVRRFAWIVGTLFAAASGLLLAPLLAQLDPSTLTLLVVQAFGAAALGSFTNLPFTFMGGLAIGIGASLSTKYFHSGILGQLPTALPFLVLVIVLLFAPKRRLAPPPILANRQPPQWRAPALFQGVGGIAIVVLLLFVPSFAGLHLNAWTSFLTASILFASLGLLTRLSGQVSLCQVSFAAIGAAAMSHFAVDHHMPWFLAVVLASLVAVPIGLLLAVPAIRLSGLYLALLSLGFGIVLQYMFFTQSYMFGQAGFGVTVPRPKLSWLNLSSDKGYYYLVLFVVALVVVALVALERSRLGRLLRSMSTGRTGLVASGASVNVTLCLVFCISAFFAALAGALDGGTLGIVSGTNYPWPLSLSYFAVILIAAGGAPWQALVAGAAVMLVPSYIQGGSVTNYLTLAFGIAAILHAVLPARQVPALIRRWSENTSHRVLTLLHLSRPRAASTVSATVSIDALSDASPALAQAADRPAGGLVVKDLRVQFGGLVAVSNASLEVPYGKVTGLIGPNGAGKTTTFNACSGLVQPNNGSVSLDDRSISRRSPAARARLGLGRTFQRTELSEDLSVRRNVALGREAGYAGLNPFGHLFSTPSQAREIRRATDAAIALCGLQDIADTQVSSLSTGQRRLVELARCLAGPFRVLLLDEPSSGLDRFETERFAEILKHVVHTRDVAVLLVEHDMALVTSVCDYIYVLDFGAALFEGTPRETIESDVVRAAYLGEEVIAMEVQHGGAGDPAAMSS
ncbi:branched-chain amino acid ABC transporter permease/ATP-binding protein [Jatrophihabitans sp.]|uniref:branched-chain amino acid ABC transporter permease/ATP-binding protein n=1 Tax=Jatrophihabitans sp. TaxID=1932789 RepID=UPI0030C76111|nr:Sulfate-transporting ATPase [Jatrophihabitans sp.]